MYNKDIIRHLISSSLRLFMVWYAVNLGFNGSIICADVNRSVCVCIHIYIYVCVCNVFNLCYYLGYVENGPNVLNRWLR